MTTQDLQDREAEVDKTKILYGMSMGVTAATETENGDEAVGLGLAKVVQRGQRVGNFTHSAVEFLVEMILIAVLHRRRD